MNYEQELINLKNAQRNAAIADLQSTRDAALSSLQAEEAKIAPYYQQQRSTANAQNRIAARNFQEYLANTGRANSGIGAQYEMSRQNNLQSDLNAINAAEAQSLADIARRRSDAQNVYNTGLAGANAQVEANYIQNLLNERQKQWEREFQQKQFDEQVRQFNQSRAGYSTGGGSSYKSTKSSTTPTNNVNNYDLIDSQLKSLISPGDRNGPDGAIIKNANQMKDLINSAYKSGKINANQVNQLALRYGL